MALNEFRCPAVCVTIVLIYLVIMDLILYIRIQSLQPPKSGVSDTGVSSNVYDITVKDIMMDPRNNHIHELLAKVFNKVTHFSEVFYFISASMVTTFHLLVALIAIKLISSDSLLTRQTGVAVFEFRNYLDSFDGVVARAHKKTSLAQSSAGTPGFYFDGVLDGLATLGLMIAVLIVLRRRNGVQYSPLPYSDIKMTPPHRNVFLPCFLFAFLLLFISVAWNFYLYKYINVLGISVPGKLSQQYEVFKSPAMCAVFWLWRLYGPLAVNELLLLAILFNKPYEFLYWMQYLGYVILIFISVVSEIQLKHAETLVFGS